MRKRDSDFLYSLSDRFPDAYIEFYSGVNEPGYGDVSTLLGDWNRVPKKTITRIEKLVNIEWLDEWSSCSDCGKLVRTNPDSYHWQPYYLIFNDCELVCLDCAESSIADYMQSIENNPNMALTTSILRKYPPEDYGYAQISEKYYNGLHEGMNDNPKKILNRLLTDNPSKRYLFGMNEQSQFYISFVVYERISEDESEEV
jgi:hypothetical protein